MKISMKNLLKGRGFYIALVLCLAASAAAAAIAVRSSLDEIENPDIMQNLPSDRAEEKEEEPWGFEADHEKPVRKDLSDLPKPSSRPSTSSSADASSRASSEKPSAVSAGQNSSVRLPKLQFALPLSGECINPYSDRELVLSVTMGEWRTHDGVDLKAAVGEEVRACGDGVILSVDNDPMWGTVIEIGHGDGFRSIYKSLNPDTAVKKGDGVKLGDVIGTVGQTALIEVGLEPHLHLEIKKGDEWRDPLDVIEKLTPAFAPKEEE